MTWEKYVCPIEHGTQFRSDKGTEVQSNSTSRSKFIRATLSFSSFVYRIEETTWQNQPILLLVLPSPLPVDMVILFKMRTDNLEIAALNLWLHELYEYTRGQKSKYTVCW